MSVQHNAAEEVRKLSGIDPKVREAIAEIVDGGRLAFLSAKETEKSLVREIEARKDVADGHPEAAKAVLSMHASIANTLMNSIERDPEAFHKQIETITQGQLKPEEVRTLLHQLKEGQKEIHDSGKYNRLVKTNEALFKEGDKLETVAFDKLRGAIEKGIDAAIDAPLRTPHQFDPEANRLR